MFLINLDYPIARFYRFLYQPEVAVYQPKGHKADIQRPRADVACEIKKLPRDDFYIFNLLEIFITQ